jgi:rare lipoprotein A (peptidoglycan hydrolase)
VPCVDLPAAPAVRHKRVGMARTTHRRRANGRRRADASPVADNAASTTLPLGTVALVTNLDNGGLHW